MMNRTVSLLTLLATVALATACSSERQTTVLIPTTPSATTRVSTSTNSTFSLLGTWTSATTVGARITLPGSLSQCSNLQLTISSQTATAAAGRLTMNCPNGVTIAGNITGQLGGATIPVVYTGAATTSTESCPFTMNGTFFPIDANTFRFEYTGTAACVGAIGGTEILRLGGSNNPSPSPSPSPSPAPAPA